MMLYLYSGFNKHRLTVLIQVEGSILKACIKKGSSRLPFNSYLIPLFIHSIGFFICRAISEQRRKDQHGQEIPAALASISIWDNSFKQISGLRDIHFVDR
jgi:hypothetical protein